MSGADLAELRSLRSGLYAIFAGDTDADKVAALNAVLDRVDARARFLPEGRLAAEARGRDPIDRLGALCADALARAMAGRPLRPTGVGGRKGRQLRVYARWRMFRHGDRRTLDAVGVAVTSGDRYQID
jgi:hypothetical protein